MNARKGFLDNYFYAEVTALCFLCYLGGGGETRENGLVENC